MATIRTPATALAVEVEALRREVERRAALHVVIVKIYCVDRHDHRHPDDRNVAHAAPSSYRVIRLRPHEVN